MVGKTGRYEGSSEPDRNSFRKKKRKIFKRTKVSALGKERRMAKILIVDDAAFMRMMLKDIVVKAGHEVAAEACDGNEALEKYREFKPDLVTMDITMPNCDGLEVVSNIITEFPDAKVVMVSAMGQQGMVLDAIKRGAKDFIVKPFQAEKVANSIANVLK
jgi:two-component system chemotaxis response regulator CheY